MSEFEPNQSGPDPAEVSRMVNRFISLHIIFQDIEIRGINEAIIIPKATLHECGIYTDQDFYDADDQTTAKFIESIIVPSLN